MLMKCWGRDAEMAAKEVPPDWVHEGTLHYWRSHAEIKKLRARLLSFCVVQHIANEYGDEPGCDDVFKTAVAEFEYDVRRFTVRVPFGYGSSDSFIEFMFEDGNYSCDCNRSLFIRQQHGEDAIAEMDCGDGTIKLLSLTIERSDPAEREKAGRS